MHRMLARVTAFSAASLAHKLCFYAGPLLVWLLLTPADMGAYSAALRPISALAVFPWLFAIPLLPGLAQLARLDRVAFGQQITYLVPFSLGLGAIAAVAGYELSADALRTLYGDRYVLDGLSAIRTLQLLCLSMGFSTASATMITILMADGHERLLVPLALTGLAITFSLNLVWLPAYGFNVAAIATLIAEIWIFAIAVVFLRRSANFPKLHLPDLSPLLPAMLLAALLQLLPSSFGWERILIGSVLSAAAILVLLQMPVVRQGRERFTNVNLGPSTNE